MKQQRPTLTFQSRGRRLGQRPADLRARPIRHVCRPRLEPLETRRLLAPAISEFPLRFQGQGGLGLVLGSDSNLWFTLPSNNIGMMNPATHSSAQFAVPTPNAAPQSLAAGPDGNLWFTESSANQIGIINPSTGAISELPLLATTNAQPQGIAAGPDGNLWFTEYNANQIGMINPTTRAISEFPLPTANAQPFGITPGPDGNLWFTESGANQVGFINPVTHAISEFPIPASGNDQAEGIAAGPDGNLWFAETAANAIGMINPTTHTAMSFALASSNAQPVGITRGPDGNLWFSEFAALSGGSHNGKLGTINPASHAISDFSVPSYNAGPAQVVAGPDGNLWFTEGNYGQLGTVNPASHAFKEYAYKNTTSGTVNELTAASNGTLWFTQQNDNQIGMLDPLMHISTQFVLPTSGSRPFGITQGPDGNIWFTEQSYSTQKVGMLNPATGASADFAVPTAGGGPDGITSGPDGNLWFTEFNAGKIGRINPSTHAIAEFPIPTANSEPARIAAGPDGNLWFTEQATGKIGAINPTTHAIQEFALPSGNAAPIGITAGSDGNLWFTESGLTLNRKIGVINPTSHAISEFPVALGGPLDIAAGPDNNLWFTEGNAGNVGMINPTTHAITELPAPKAYPQSITGDSDGNVWFTGNGTFSVGTTNPNILGVVLLSSSSIATGLAIATQPPGSVAANRGFGLTVAVKTAAGALAVDFTGTVTIALGNNPGGATLGGTLTAQVNNGVAVFSGLTLDKGGSGYTIQATAAGLTPATTNAFHVALPATQLVVTTEPPASVTAGSSFGLVVSAEDALGDVDPNYSGNVLLAIANNPGGSTLGGPVLAAASAGVAAFSVSLNKLGSGYTLKATSGALAPATTSAINVAAAPATQLVLTAQPPASVVSGSPFGLAVSAEDSFGNVDQTFTGNIALAIANNPAGGTLGGSLNAAAQSGVATFAGLTLDKAGSGYTLSAASSSLGPATTSAITVSAAAATHLVVTAQPPASVRAATGFDLGLAAEDPAGNLDTSFSGSVTLAIASNPGGATLTGALSMPASGGLASFSGLKLDQGGNGYTLQASATGLAAATTNPFSVTLPATRLVVTIAPPSSVVAGGQFGLTLAAEDTLGNVDPTYNGSMTLAIATNPGGSTLGGTTTATASAGVATFSGLSLNKSGSGYTLSAASGSLSAATAGPIAVSPAAASQLVITAQPPPGVTAGDGFGLGVSAEDAFGNLDSTFSGTITLAIANNPGGSVLGGTASSAASGGVASFTGLELNKAGGGYTLKAAATGLSSATTSAIMVSPGPAAALVVTIAPPSSVVAGLPFGLTVSAEDALGNIDPAYHSSVTLAIATNPGGSTLGGTTTTTASGGVATFSGLSLNKAGSGYTLQASSGSLGSVTIGPINVSPAAATQLVITAQPPADVTAGAGFGVGVSAEDSFGNLDSNFSGTVSLTIANNPGGSVLGGTASSAASGGLVSFAGLSLNKVGAGYTLQATATGLSSATTSAVTVSPAAASALAVTTEPPASVAAGAGFRVVIAAQDAFGNPVTSFSGSVTMAIANNPNAATLGGTLTVPASDGVATFSPLTLSKGGIGYTLTATASGLAPVTTSALSALAAPGDLDGDGKTDTTIYDQTTSQFLIQLSSGGTKSPQFGNPSHRNIPLAGDFDGDGKADIAIYDQTTSQFFILLSGGGAKTPQFGNPGHTNIPMSGDFDGDGKADIAIYDQTASKFFILLSGGGAKTPQFGNPAHTNIPLSGDFDGDGKADTAIYDQTISQFFVLLSGGGAKTPQFGNPGHTNIPLAGDFDGDGKADVAIYDQTTSQFFILLSGGGAKTPQFGNPGHKNIPVVGDFDGDGKADTAIYDQTLSQFFILESGGGALVPTLGNPGHINVPVPSVYVPPNTHTASAARAAAPPAGGNGAVTATSPRVELVAVIRRKDKR